MAEALVIPDASVILKWVLPSADEADMGRAMALRDAIASGNLQALVPELWLYEVGNTLARRLPSQADQLLDSLLRFNLPSAAPSYRWFSQVLGLTRRYGVTFYDAAYHAHAILERGVFVMRMSATSGKPARRSSSCGSPIGTLRRKTPPHLAT